MAATGFAKITWNETKTPSPKPLTQVKHLGSWGRVCPKVTSSGDQMHVLGGESVEAAGARAGQSLEPQILLVAPSFPTTLTLRAGYRSNN